MHLSVCWYLLHSLSQSGWNGFLAIVPVAHYSCPLKSLMIVDVHLLVAELLLGLEAAAWHRWHDLRMHVNDEIHVIYDHHCTVCHLATSMNYSKHYIIQLSRACKLRELCINSAHTKFRWLSWNRLWGIRFLNLSLKVRFLQWQNKISQSNETPNNDIPFPQ